MCTLESVPKILYESGMKPHKYASTGNYNFFSIYIISSSDLHFNRGQLLKIKISKTSFSLQTSNSP